MAEQSLAYEDAAKWFERAASLPEMSLADRARLDLDAAQITCGPVISPERGPSTNALARWTIRSAGLEAAVGYEDANWRRGKANSKAADLLASALESCGLNTDDPHYVQALGSFGRALAFAGEAVRAREIGNSAIDRARLADDPAVTHAHTEDEPVARAHPGDVRNPVGAVGRGSRIALLRRDYEALGKASHFRAIVNYLAGRPDDLAASAADMRRAGPSLRTTRLRLRWRVRRAGAGLSARRLRRRRAVGRHRFARG